MIDRNIAPGTLVVVLDGGAFYGKIAEFKYYTPDGIVVQVPPGAHDALHTAWRFREAGRYVEQS